MANKIDCSKRNEIGCVDRDDRLECAVPGGDKQAQYGRRFVTPDETFILGSVSNLMQPDDVCTQVDEIKPLGEINEDIERTCDRPSRRFNGDEIDRTRDIQDLYFQFALDKFLKNGGFDGIFNRQGSFSFLSRNPGAVEAKILLADGTTDVFSRTVCGVVAPIPPASTVPTAARMRIEATKKMCSLKEYSFTIGQGE